MQATTTDSKGRVWHFPVTYWAIKRIRKECGVDLCNLFSSDLMTRMKTDYPLMLEIGYEIVRDTAKERQVSFDDWVALWTSDELDALLDAIIEGIGLFFPPARRAILTLAMKTVKEAIETALQAIKSSNGSGDAQGSSGSTLTGGHSAPLLPQPMPVD